MEKVITVSNLVKKYHDVVALDGVSFDIFKGEVFSLVGPNGSGKTTTVEILECLRKPSSGSAKVLGFDILKDELEIKKRIGVVPQEFNTFERLTVKENVQLISEIYAKKSDIKSLLEDMDLWEIRNKRFGTLSGGQKRRVGIAMALISDPEIVFLDEPTTGLDPVSRRECWEFIRKLRKSGKTVFLTTHYMEEVEQLSDRISIIIKGKILNTGTVKELINQYGMGSRVIIKEPDLKIETVLKKYAEKTYKDDLNHLIGTFSNRKDALKALSDIYNANENCKVELIESSMEEVFINIAGKRINERGELVE